jgi:hypothetical protein
MQLSKCLVLLYQVAAGALLATVYHGDRYDVVAGDFLSQLLDAHTELHCKRRPRAGSTPWLHS